MDEFLCEAYRGLRPSAQFRNSDWRAGVMDRGNERVGEGGVLTPAGIVQDL